MRGLQGADQVARTRLSVLSWCLQCAGICLSFITTGDSFAVASGSHQNMLLTSAGCLLFAGLLRTARALGSSHERGCVVTGVPLCSNLKLSMLVHLLRTLGPSMLLAFGSSATLLDRSSCVRLRGRGGSLLHFRKASSPVPTDRSSESCLDIYAFSYP